VAQRNPPVRGFEPTPLTWWYLEDEGARQKCITRTSWQTVYDMVAELGVYFCLLHLGWS